jgi:outer membrane protein OmpA-like peptidoglycan-associated protein
MNRHHRLYLAGIFIISIILTSCGPRNLVVLVPDPNGSVGEVSVTNPAGSVRIHTANQFTEIKDRQSPPRTPEPMDQTEIHDIFAQALAIEPSQSVHFILYFKTDSTDLLPASAGMLSEIAATIRRQASKHISVVGHTDTMGDKAYNLALSRRRATTVKDRLVSMGIDEASLEVTSHGEENPIVNTADNVANAKNRRVEVVVH